MMTEALQSQTRTYLSHSQCSDRFLIVLKLQLKFPAKHQGFRAKVQDFHPSQNCNHLMKERKEDEERSLRC